MTHDSNMGMRRRIQRTAISFIAFALNNFPNPSSYDRLPARTRNMAYASSESSVGVIESESSERGSMTENGRFIGLPCYMKLTHVYWRATGA